MTEFAFLMDSLTFRKQRSKYDCAWKSGKDKNVSELSSYKKEGHCLNWIRHLDDSMGGHFFLDYGPLNVDVVGSIDILSNIKFCTLMKIF